jgi:hypothetical protein
VQKVREAAARSQCTNNLKQIGLSAHSAHDFAKHLPRFAFQFPKTASPTGQRMSTFWALLPYLDQRPMYEFMTATQNSSAYNSSNAKMCFVPAYLCPTDPSDFINRSQAIGVPGNLFNLASYVVNGQVFVEAWTNLSSGIPDGTSNTVMFCEHIALCPLAAGGNSATVGRNVWPATNFTTGDALIYWNGSVNAAGVPADAPPASTGFFNSAYGAAAKVTDPVTGTQMWKLPQPNPKMRITGTGACDPLTANGGHPGHVIVCMADGTVRAVPGSITLQTWNALLTPKGNEPVTLDF